MTRVACNDKKKQKLLRSSCVLITDAAVPSPAGRRWFPVIHRSELASVAVSNLKPTTAHVLDEV